MYVLQEFLQLEAYVSDLICQHRIAYNTEIFIIIQLIQQLSSRWIPAQDCVSANITPVFKYIAITSYQLISLTLIV